MVITEAELREMWRDGRYPLPAFPPGTRFSPAAQDFIKEQQLEIRFADPAPGLPAADLQLPPPTDSLAASIDFLHALVLLSAAEARRYQLPALAQRLDALAAYCLELLAADGHRQPPAWAPAPQPAATALAFVAPGATDHAIVHWLNLVRAAAGQAAAQAQATGAANASVAAGLRQLSDAAADLSRRVQSGELGWNSAMV